MASDLLLPASALPRRVGYIASLMSTQLALFPLKTVLFPGALLPLHIFEPRYRQMLIDVTAGDRRFGLLPPGDGGGLPAPGTVGCVAVVRAVQPLPDGRSNIVVAGEQRFAFLEPVPSATPYHRGLVDWVDDEPDIQVPSEDELARLKALAQRYAVALNAVRDQALDPELSGGAADLSFQVAALLEWEFDARHSLLASRSVTARVTRLLHALPSLVQETESRALVHERARSNGTGARS